MKEAESFTLYIASVSSDVEYFVSHKHWMRSYSLNPFMHWADSDVAMFRVYLVKFSMKVAINLWRLPNGHCIAKSVHVLNNYSWFSRSLFKLACVFPFFFCGTMISFQKHFSFLLWRTTGMFAHHWGVTRMSEIFRYCIANTLCFADQIVALRNRIKLSFKKPSMFFHLFSSRNSTKCLK